MTSLNEIFNDLLFLQSRLTSTVNELWRLKFALVEAQHRADVESDFLLRRLVQCQDDAQRKQEALLQALRVRVASCQNSFLVFSSDDDVETALRLRTLIRYLQNAFDQDLPLVPALKRMGTSV